MSSARGQPVTAGIVLFDRFTGLDVVGPHEVLARACERCLLIARDLAAVQSDRGLRLLPDASFAQVGPVDLLVVPGGPGQSAAMEDQALLAFLRARAATARHVLGVCTGSLLLARAGLLAGQPATTHWLARAELRRLGVVVQSKRVVWSGKILTSAGVTSGIDAALELVGAVYGVRAAQRIQLALEYDPQPPHQSGRPETAPADLVAELEQSSRFNQ